MHHQSFTIGQFYSGIGSQIALFRLNLLQLQEYPGFLEISYNKIPADLSSDEPGKG